MNNNKNNKTTVSQRVLRKLVDRVLPVVERHRSDVGVETAAERVVPAAQAFAKAYDQAITYQSNQLSELEQRRVSFLELETLLRSSLAIVRAMVPNMDTTELTAKADMPGELVLSAGRVIELLSQATGEAKGRTALLEALKAATDKAKQTWAEAQAARAELQQIQAGVREYAVAFNRELVALRTVLRAVVGTHNVDYQTLRVNRGSPEAESEDTVIEDDTVDPLGKTGEMSAVTNGKSLSNGGTHTPVFATA